MWGRGGGHGCNTTVPIAHPTMRTYWKESTAVPSCATPVRYVFHTSVQTMCAHCLDPVYIHIQPGISRYCNGNNVMYVADTLDANLLPVTHV